MEAKKKSSRQTTKPVQPAPPICMALRSAGEAASRNCLSVMEALLIKHPTVKASLEAIRHNDRVVELVLAIYPPKTAKWDNPNAQLLAVHTLITNVFGQMHDYDPAFIGRPDDDDRAYALNFARQFLAPVFSAHAA